MAEMDRIGSRTVRMTSEEIVQRGFSTKVRGLSETDVRSFLKRVAEEVDRLGNREDELLDLVSKLQSELAAKPKATKAELLESLGEQTTRVLSSAEEAAEQMLNDATAAAEKMRADAKSESEQVIIDARKQAQETLEDAQDRVKSLRESSARDSDTVISQARTKGREIFQESVVVREQILKDLLRRRDLLIEQIEELRRGREELLESYKVVKGSFQKATDALHSVEEKAASELMANPIDVDELLKSPVELPIVLQDGQPIVSSAPQKQPETVKIEDSKVENTEPSSESVVFDGQKSEAKSDDVVIGKEAQSSDSTGVETLRSVLPETKSKDISDDGASPKRKQLKNYVKDALGVGEDGETSADVHVIVSEPDVEVSASPTSSTVTPVAKKKDVGALFQSLKSQTPQQSSVSAANDKTENNAEKQDVQPVQQAQSSKATSSDNQVVTGEVKNSKVDATDGDLDQNQSSKEKKSKKKKSKIDPIETRDEVLSNVTTSILRKAKRQLQDEQNELLEALRTIKSKKRVSAENILSDEQTQIKSWEEAIRSDLESVFQAGAATVSSEKQKYDSAAIKSAVNWVVSPLRETLIMAIDEGEQADATSRVGARYREWRNSDLKNALYDALCSAFNNGVVQAAKNDATLKWNVEKAGRCPDCDDNALEPTPARESFPTGQVAPPAHSGCRCVLTVA